MNKKSLLIGLLIGVLIGVLLLLWQRKAFRAEIEGIEGKVEQVIIRDTITLSKPIYVSRKVLDTLFLPADTIRLRDTIYLILEKEQKVYEDSTYRAVVSGVMPSLDTISVYPTTIYETREKKVPYKWGIGVSAGYGATLVNKQVYMSPFIGVTINYNILSF